MQTTKLQAGLIAMHAPELIARKRMIHSTTQSSLVMKGLPMFPLLPK